MSADPEDIAKVEADPEGVDAYCFFCERKFADRGLEPDDYYCYGCSEYICDECSPCDPWGNHDVMDHQECDEEEDPFYGSP